MDPGPLRNPKMITQPKMAGSFSETGDIEYMGRIQSSVLHVVHSSSGIYSCRGSTEYMCTKYSR